jgi:chorismate mutase
VPGRSRGDVHRPGHAGGNPGGDARAAGGVRPANGIAAEDIASAFFTSTADLRSAFPARAARDLGWTDVPLLGATEVDKPGAPPRYIRALLHWNTSRRQDEVVHVYLRGSDVMRAQDPPSHLASGAHAEGPGA